MCRDRRVDQDVPGMHAPASTFAGLLVAAVEHHGGVRPQMNVPRDSGTRRKYGGGRRAEDEHGALAYRTRRRPAIGPPRDKAVQDRRGRDGLPK